MPDPLIVECPSCSQKYRVSPSAVGQNARCAKCKTAFVVTAPAPFDEDTIVSWISEPNPNAESAAQKPDRAADSVMGSTGLFHPPEAPPPPAHDPAVPRLAHDGPPSQPPAEPETPSVRLARIDEEGAHFEFPVSALASEELRDAFPRKCAGCGIRHGLSIHLVYWPDLMKSQDAVHWKEYQNTPVGEWEQYSHIAGHAWLRRLPAPRHAARPFNEPFPFLICRHCHASREVQGRMVVHRSGEVCGLMIRSLATAVEFYRHNGGRHCPDYQKLIEERDIRHDRRNELTPDVRTRLSHWFTPLPGEQFVRYFPDAEFSATEAGNAGAVLTVRRLVFKKFAAYRDYPLNQACRVEIKSGGAHATVQIMEEGHRPALLALTDANASQLVLALRSLKCRWSIVR